MNLVKLAFLVNILWIFVFIAIYQKYLSFLSLPKQTETINHLSLKFNSLLNDIKNEKIIFMGGFWSSGTTLMRSILDVHPEVKCGPETKITHETLTFLKRFRHNPQDSKFVLNAGIQNATIDNAISFYISYILLNNIQTKSVKFICNKEPKNMLYISYLKELFPASKFIYIVRDGREAAYSFNHRQNITNSFNRFYQSLRLWNFMNKEAYKQCLNTGKEYCRIVRYENLVLKPRETIQELIDFLGIFWTDKFLHHQDYIGKDIRVSLKEWSFDKIKNRINNKSLKNWQGNVFNYSPAIVEKEINMLKVFNYI